MADDRLFRVIVLGGIALIGAAPATAGCTPTDVPGEGTQVPQSQTVVASATAASPLDASAPPPPREGPPTPPPPHTPPVVTAPVDAGVPPLPVAPPLDAGTDGGFHLKPPREGPPPRPKQGL
jgi:hypothetical protein